jgi:hypothetical protein
MLWLFLSTLAYAQCGTYEFKGTPRIVEDQMQVVLNEKSLSQFILYPAMSDQMKLAPYVDLMVQGELRISKMIEPREGDAVDFMKLDYAIPDPLNPVQNSFLRLKKEETCL